MRCHHDCIAFHPLSSLSAAARLVLPFRGRKREQLDSASKPMFGIDVIGRSERIYCNGSIHDAFELTPSTAEGRAMIPPEGE